MMKYDDDDGEVLWWSMMNDEHEVLSWSMMMKYDEWSMM